MEADFSLHCYIFLKFYSFIFMQSVWPVLLTFVVSGGRLLKGDKKYCVINYQLVYKPTFQAHRSSARLYRV